MSYAGQRARQDIQAFLPEEYRILPGLDQMVYAISGFCAGVSVA
jgi:hypothetical protein